VDADLSWFDCPCGESHLLPAQPLLKFDTGLGPLITVTVAAGSWLVPRVWIAAHGLKAAELSLLAYDHDWPETL
jgi:hypothetical protein